MKVTKKLVCGTKIIAVEGGIQITNTIEALKPNRETIRSMNELLQHVMREMNPSLSINSKYSTLSVTIANNVELHRVVEIAIMLLELNQAIAIQQCTSARIGELLAMLLSKYEKDKPTTPKQNRQSSKRA